MGQEEARRDGPHRPAYRGQIVARRKILDAATALEKAITPKQRKEWAAGAPEQWANELHKIAVETVYKDVPADGPPPRLTKEYLDAAQRVAAEQIGRAGVRLATVLNIALK